MTVHEFIQRLQAMPPTAEVIIQSPEDEEYHKPLRDLGMGTYSHNFEYADAVFICRTQFCVGVFFRH